MFERTWRNPNSEATRNRARRRAERILRGAACRNDEVPDLMALADKVQGSGRFSRAASERAASEALQGAY